MKKMKLNIQLFATSCAVSITGITQDIENNCSTITVHGELTTSSSTYNHEGGAYMQPVISNQPVVGTQTSSQTLSKKKFSINTSSTKKLDWEFTVYHNSDGSCPTLTVKINWYATSNTNGTVTLSGGYTPATIPRASDVAATDGTLNVTNDVSITITRKNNNFTHTLRYVCGNASGWIKDSNNKVATSATWTPPISLANQNQSGDSVSCKIYCQTYNGSTAIGSETETTITLTIPTLNPTASLTTISDNTSYYSTYGAYIQNKSTIKSTLSGTAQYSTINTYYWEIRQNSTTGTLLASGDTTNITYTPTVSGTIYVIGTVTDKRGNSHSTSRNVSITAYKTPTCSLVVSRTNSTTASYTITGSGSPISVSGKTANVVNYVLKRDSTNIYSSSGASLNRTSTDTITDQSYTYTLIASDTISGTTDTKVVTISTTFTLMNFNSTGYAMAIGKASEATGTNKLLEIALPTKITEKTQLDGGSRVHYFSGGSGTSGYMKVATLVIKDLYCNNPIIFEVAQRSRHGIFYIIFSATANTDPSIYAFRKTGDINVYIFKTTTSTWDLYIQKSEAWDGIEIVRYHTSTRGDTQVELTWNGAGTTVSSVPSGYIEATLYNVASKVGTSNVGNISRPIYLDSGTATICKTPSSGSYFGGVPCVNSSEGIMEIGKYIDFHNTSGSTNDYDTRLQCNGATKNTLTLPTSSGTLALIPVTLYIGDTYTTDNNIGTAAGSVTLSETSANFSYIEIFYRPYTKNVYDNYRAGWSSVKVPYPNGKKVQLILDYDNGTYWYHCFSTWTFSGTSLTKNDEKRWRVAASTAAQTRTNNTTSDPTISICKIVGYR